MKTLILLRHAKSDWESEWDDDLQRPLTKRGRKAAARVGRCLSLLGQAPDFALTSPAERARSTLELARGEGRWDCPAEVSSRLYEAGPTEVLALVHAQDEDHEIVLMTGHEPVFSSLAGRLIGSARIRFPTAAMIRIDFQCQHWRDVDFGAGELVWFLVPRLLGKLGLE